MPRSMTGFARCDSQSPRGSLTWEIRSVNHRYLEAAFRIPETLRDLEPELRERITAKLKRGKVESFLQFRASNIVTGSDVDLERASEIVAASRAVGELLPDVAPVNPIDILKWPGVLKEPEVDGEALKKEALELFDRTLDQLVDTRGREGDKLKAAIAQRLDGIAVIVAEVRQAMPQLLEAQQKKILDRLEEIRGEIDQDRLEQELAYLAQRSDVDEELDRLEAHLSELRSVLEGRDAMGRRLDFLMQELNREANTLASKSMAVSITRSAVELKVLVEQMREQIQNIE